MGRLARYLARGEYGQLRDCPLFESDFLQVTRSGEPASQVTVAIAATSPLLPRPDLLLLARPAPPSPPEPEEELQLLGLLPLSVVRLSLRSLQRHQLRVRLVTGRTFYLQLLAPPPRLPRLFSRWLRLLFLLREAGGGSPETLPGTGQGWASLDPDKGGREMGSPPPPGLGQDLTPRKDRQTRQCPKNRALDPLCCKRAKF